MIKRLILSLFLLLMAMPPAHAQIYARASWENLLKSLIRFGALDISDDKILDEYAVVTDCDIFKAFSPNDFKWNQVREVVRQSIQMNLSKFPANYVYEDHIALDRYDFQEQMYHFSSKNPLQKVNAFFLYRSDGLTCEAREIKYLPRAFRAVLDESVSLPGLPLTQRSADALLRRMAANDNKDRFVFVRFNLHINYIGKVEKNPDASPADTIYSQKGAGLGAPILLNAQVDTIDFYEDDHYTKLLYSYQP